MLKENRKRRSDNCYDQNLREIIAWRIASERKKKYPEVGGMGKCAEDFGKSLQQWSQYEHARRTPRDERLQEIADFFGVGIDHMKTAPDNWEELRKTGDGMQNAQSLPEEMTRQADIGTPADNSHSSPKTAPKGSIPIVDLIRKIINMENLHGEGMIATEAYEQTIGTIEALVSLVEKSKIRQEK